ncbi:MAG: nuclease [Gammaproteobacteria bacterium]|nr:MAG: nuclease [Gammaproteobacteria bacterium]
MRRFVDKSLKKWQKSTDRKPLIVRGARQVGKTYIIEKFANENFENYIKIDFEKNHSFIKIFAEDFDAQKIVDIIEIETKTNIIIGKTLLFLDEIQLAPRALMALRYFYEDMPKLHIVAAGSLLEFELDKISYPVGRVEFMYMLPMSFAEFLIATKNKKLLKYRPNLQDNKKLPVLIHNKLLKLLKEYMLVGGMPEAVKTYITKSMRYVVKVHSNLITSFLQDILKYQKNIQTDSLSFVFEKLPSLVGQEIKYTTISKDITAYKIKNILQVLRKAMLINISYATSASGLPLTQGANIKSFKICFLDIGLMQHICGINPTEFIQNNDLLATYRGALAEQYIGQELMANGGSQNNRLFYWQRNKKNSNAEVDYLIVRDNKIYPIEIKNGPAGKLKSLHLFLKENPKIKQGFVLNSGNIGQIDNLNFLPLYADLNDERPLHRASTTYTNNKMHLLY